VDPKSRYSKRSVASGKHACSVLRGAGRGVNLSFLMNHKGEFTLKEAGTGDIYKV
jgi:hypothetical protein